MESVVGLLVSRVCRVWYVARDEGIIIKRTLHIISRRGRLSGCAGVLACLVTSFRFSSFKFHVLSRRADCILDASTKKLMNNYMIITC